MAVKLESYRVFREVAETGNISLAAQNLNISQSAVSQSIRQLESSLQTQLFLRSPRGVTLTGEGRTLYEYVRSALSLISSGEERLAQAHQLHSGSLVIGASDTITAWFLTPYLERFHREYPGVRLRIVSGRSGKVLELLRSGVVDISFASSPARHSGLTCWPCFRTHTAFVAARDYPCNFDYPHTARELAELPLILLDRKASSRMFLERVFQQHGVALAPEIELSSRALLVSLARIGLGVAGVTLEFVEDALASGEIRLLKTAFTIPSRSVDMCTLSDALPSAAAARFMAMVKEGKE